MSFELQRDELEKFCITLKDEPPYCRGLVSAPRAREPELDQGTWLVLCFAGWSGPDVAAVQVALDAAKRMGGRLNLGVRPYDYREEHAAWCTEIKDQRGSPIWVLLHNGDVLWWRTGELTVEDLVAAIETSPV
jgi:hypothetical protein